MSGAHCIDFYNKSTLTFIVIYLCFSSCFLLCHHLLKTRAECIAVPYVFAVSGCCWGRSEFRRLPAEPRVLGALEEAAAGRALSYQLRLCDSREVTESAPELAARLAVWCVLRSPRGCCSVCCRRTNPGSRSFLLQQRQLWVYVGQSCSSRCWADHSHLQLLSSVWFGLCIHGDFSALNEYHSSRCCVSGQNTLLLHAIL